MALTTFELSCSPIGGFAAYRFLYERLFGARVRPWLPAAFCAAAGLPPRAEPLPAGLGRQREDRARRLMVDDRADFFPEMAEGGAFVSVQRRHGVARDSDEKGGREGVCRLS